MLRGLYFVLVVGLVIAAGDFSPARGADDLASAAIVRSPQADHSQQSDAPVYQSSRPDSHDACGPVNKVIVSTELVQSSFDVPLLTEPLAVPSAAMAPTTLQSQCVRLQI